MTALLLSLVLGADPAPPVVVEIPTSSKWAEVEAPLRTLVRLSPVDGKPAQWCLIDDKSATLFDLNGSAQFWAAEPGSYRLVAYSTERGFVKLTVVVKGAPAPPGPAPGPTPGPLPPPNPTDPLTVRVRKAYQDSAEADKDNTRKELIVLFTQAQKLALGGTVDTTQALFDQVAAASDLMVGKGRLTDVRAVIADELGKAFPEDVPLSEEQKKAAAAMFAKIAAALSV